MTLKQFKTSLNEDNIRWAKEFMERFERRYPERSRKLTGEFYTRPGTPVAGTP